MYTTSMFRFRVCITNLTFKRSCYTMNPAVLHSAVPRLRDGILRGDRATLAESITLVESSNKKRKGIAHQLLSELSNIETSRSKPTFRIGLSGPPGSGKSTFIEAFGKMLTKQGEKVAVLAVDPSSMQSGGSLLGDKTRMPDLSADPHAYIRPSPSCGTLGGVTRSTNDAVVLCEYAGYDIILVETVGVGQSEFAVADMVDLFVLLIPPAGGDELQGIKKGIVEVADIIAVTKGDGVLLSSAKHQQAEYISATKFMRPRSKHWRTKVMRISSLTKEGLPELWESCEDFKRKMLDAGEFQAKRERQLLVWMWTYISNNLMDVFKSDPDVKEAFAGIKAKVLNREIAPSLAADTLLNKFTKRG